MLVTCKSRMAYKGVMRNPGRPFEMEDKLAKALIAEGQMLAATAGRPPAAGPQGRPPVETAMRAGGKGRRGRAKAAGPEMTD